MIVRKDKFIMLVIFLLVLACAGGGFGLFQSRPVEISAKPLKISTVGEFRGFALKLHNSNPKIPYEKYVDEIAATGANTVLLVVAAYQENCSSACIFMDSRKVPPDSRIQNIIARAHKKGLKVILMPVVLLKNPRTDEWRGKISPADSNWDKWWSDYGKYIMHYVSLARKSNVEVMMVGSELVSTENQTHRWKNLIARIRKVYKGKLCYSANWDHYRPVKWWGELDMIGMTSYYDLTGGKEPTVKRLVKSWKPIRKEILEWRKKINRPILFTEVGWPNQVNCAQYPWNYYQTEKTDPQAQANCFEAFFRTWSQEKSVAGYMVWEWRNSPSRGIDPKTDFSYVPTGKPSLAVIKKYFKKPPPKPITKITKTTKITKENKQ